MSTAEQGPVKPADNPATGDGELKRSLSHGQMTMIAMGLAL